MTTFVAHDQHAPTARAFAWAMRGVGLLGALVVVVLLLTGVLDVDADWGWCVGTHLSLRHDDRAAFVVGFRRGHVESAGERSGRVRDGAVVNERREGDAHGKALQRREVRPTSSKHGRYMTTFRKALREPVMAADGTCLNMHEVEAARERWRRKGRS